MQLIPTINSTDYAFINLSVELFIHLVKYLIDIVVALTWPNHSKQDKSVNNWQNLLQMSGIKLQIQFYITTISLPVQIIFVWPAILWSGLLLNQPVWMPATH